MSEVPHDELRRRSALACGRLVEQPEYRRAEVVMIFLSRFKFYYVFCPFTDSILWSTYKHGLITYLNPN